MADAAYDVVLFDLGGVLIELGGLPIRMDGAGEPTDEKDWRRWLTSPSVRRFESGRSTPEEFGRAMVEEFGIGVTPQAFIDAFAGWPKGFYPGAEEMLERTREHCEIGCLSNSNPIHWERFHAELGLGERFDHRFASHLIGSTKPDRELFEHVVERLGCPAHRVLFLDDNQPCVDGARDVGLLARRVQGVAGASDALRELGLL